MSCRGAVVTSLQSQLYVKRVNFAGLLCLSGCLNLLRYFQSPANRKFLSHELNNARSVSEETWETPPDRQHEEDARFPFIQTCVTLGAGLNIEEGYEATISVLPFNIDISECDNNDGFTVIDVSNLDRVRYCFFVDGGVETAEYRHKQGMTNEDGDGSSEWLEPTEENIIPRLVPLKAEQYLSGYYFRGSKDWSATLDEKLRSFEDWPLVNVAALKETWPDHPWNDDVEEQKSDRSSPAGTTLSLRNASMQKLIGEALHDPENGDWIQEAECLPDFVPILRSYLYEHPESVHTSPGGLTLLRKCLAGSKDVDLSPFGQLPTETIRELIVSTSTTVEQLDLSGTNISEELLRETIRTTQLTELTVMQNPVLPLKTVLDSIKQTQASAPTAVNHPELFSGPFQEPSTITCRDFPAGRVPWTRLISENHDDPWVPYQSLMCCAMDVRDALVSPRKAILGTARYMRLVANTRMHSGVSEALAGAAKCFALSSDVRDHDLLDLLWLTHADRAEQDERKVSPIPGELYRTGKTLYHTSWELPPEFQEIKTGEWTVLVVRIRTDYMRSLNTPDVQSLGYAFVSADDDGNTIAVDLLGFLELVAGTDATSSSMSTRLAEIWDNEMSILRQAVTKNAETKSGEEALDTEVVRVCGTQEVEEVLKAMQEYKARRERGLPR
ncbi:hypothetical protein H2199_007125 [Coniosporium tulheliwenetii]|uniref:Uncharacterized protein n=1 Tax=Coniosporium tulheliwenetii TaxID=3383036 RepID=A0ACC2YT51_9PEZI|nr:hypothetical protein H2199_007125 [Cladosporium sp. JES 115]